MDQLDKETNETHNQEPNAGSLCDLHELFSVGLGALLDQMHGIPSKLLEWLDQNLIETFLLGHFVVVFWNCEGKEAEPC